MRYAALVAVFLSLPILIGLIGRDGKRRDWAVLALGVLMFYTGALDLSAALIVWPAWQGLSKGIIFSLLDTIAIALIATRAKRFNRAHFCPRALNTAAREHRMVSRLDVLLDPGRDAFAWAETFAMIRSSP